MITETVRRETAERSIDDPEYVQALKNRVIRPDSGQTEDFDKFVKDPLVAWIETTFGITSEPESGRLVRAEPLTISGEHGGAHKLARLINVDVAVCEKAIQKVLLQGFQCKNKKTGFPTFAFRLHQFISRGDTAYSSLQNEESRYITISGQQFVPGDREKILFPIVFCRECGQDYFSVRQSTQSQMNRSSYKGRDAYEKVVKSDEYIDGFLFSNGSVIWPADPD